MSYDALLNQTVSHYAKTGYGADGRRTFSAAVSTPARVELKQKRKLLPNGSVIITEGTIFLKGTVTADTDDKFTFNGVDYAAYSVYKVPADNGTTHHLEVVITKQRAS